MSISIALCGLVRDRQLLTTKMTQWQQWRAEGLIDKIVYATWLEEIDQYEGLRDELKAAGVDVIEIEEPRLILKHGHQLHQMTSFHYALAAIPDDDQFVLKTRVDLSGHDINMPNLFRTGTPRAEDFLGVGLQNKIVVDYAQMLYPFLCGDAQFFGRKRDLARLVNLSTEMEMLFCRLAVEQTFFFQPFRHVALFRTHFYWNLPHVSEMARNRAGLIKALLRAPEMQDALKAWWIVLKNYFQVGWGRPLPAPALSGLAEALEIKVDHVKSQGFDQSDLLLNDGFVNALNEMIPADERAALVEKMKTQPDRQLAIPARTFDAYEGFRRQVSDLGGPRAVREGDERKTIRGAQHFFIKNEDQASYAYQTELVQLRREIHRVTELLRGTGHLEFRNFMHRWLLRSLPRPMVRFVRDRMPAVTETYLRYLSGDRLKR